VTTITAPLMTALTVTSTTMPALGQVLAPDVTGLPLSEAANVLLAAGLPYDITTARVPGIADGVVVGQSVAPGATISSSTLLTLVVASGQPSTTTLPDRSPDVTVETIEQQPSTLPTTIVQPTTTTP
jgi:beta-lactam-binding protein with PASTA domain